MSNKKKLVNCQGQKVKYQQKVIITGNTHVNYHSSSIYYSNVVNKVKVFKRRPDSKVKVTRLKNVGFDGLDLLLEILM